MEDSQQCRGITKSGARCKIKRNLIHGYCQFHRNGQGKIDLSGRSETDTDRSEPEITEPTPVVRLGHLAVLVSLVVVGIAVCMFLYHLTRGRSDR